MTLAGMEVNNRRSWGSPGPARVVCPPRRISALRRMLNRSPGHLIARGRNGLPLRAVRPDGAHRSCGAHRGASNVGSGRGGYRAASPYGPNLALPVTLAVTADAKSLRLHVCQHPDGIVTP